MINKLANVNAKRLKIKEKDREALPHFQKEEAETNCVHQKEMAAMYFQFITQSAFAKNMPAVPSSFPSPTMHYADRNSGFYYMLPASTALRTPHLETSSPHSSPPAPSYEAVDEYNRFSRISQ